jgi:hypothetical protein
MLTRMAAGEDQPIDQFGMLDIRFNKGDSHQAASGWRRPGAGFS